MAELLYDAKLTSDEPETLKFFKYNLDAVLSGNANKHITEARTLLEQYLALEYLDSRAGTVMPDFR